MEEKPRAHIFFLSALLPYLTIVTHLLFTRRASFAKSSNAPYRAQCVDARIPADEKRYLILGGQTGLSSGLIYFGLAKLARPVWLKSLFTAYGKLHVTLLCIQLPWLLRQIAQDKPSEKISIRIHNHGCGHATAASPFWWLYWLPGWRGVTIWRDRLMIIDLIQSLPTHLLIHMLSYKLWGIDLETDITDLRETP